MTTLNNVQIVSLTLRPYALRLRQPLRSATGSFHHRHGCLLLARTDDGLLGVGDAAPWPGFGSSHEQVMLALGRLADGDELSGMTFASLAELTSQLNAAALPPEVRHALELAALDVLAQRQRLPLAKLLHGTGVAREVLCQQLIVGEEPIQGRFIKLKIGAHSLAHDRARIDALLARAGADARLRLDANGAYDLATAQRALAAFACPQLDSLEQPLGRAAQLAAWTTLHQQARAQGVALLADESIVDAASLRRFALAQAIDGVVLKPMFLGGLLPALELARQAQQAGLSVTITSALESAVGRAGALHLASGFVGQHGLDSVLAEDVAELVPRQGRIRCPARHGLGIVPDLPQPLTPARDAYALPHPLASAALAEPNRVALRCEGIELSYAQLRAAVAQEAGALAVRGVEPGALVALRGPVDAAWVVRLHAIGWLGAAVAPEPADLAPAQLRDWLRAVKPDRQLDSREALPPAAPLPERFWPLDEVRLVVCSSGSTGAPKAIRLTVGQLAFSAFGSALRLGHTADDRWLCCLPLHHVGGLSILLRCAFAATTVLLQPRFDAARVAAALDGGEASLVSLVPAMLARVLAARPERPFPASLRAVLLGGAPASPELLARCAALAVPVAVSWGMTEAASQIATCPPDAAGHATERGDCGPALAFARVDQEHDRLRVRGPIVRGSLLSADRGKLIDGRVQLLGRADDVIISGGENIPPQPLEALLRGHPQVADAMVVALPSARWGQRPAALVTPTPDSGAPPDAEQLRQHCRAALAGFMVPDHFIVVDALPQSALGKPSRHRGRLLVERWLNNQPEPPPPSDPRARQQLRSSRSEGRSTR